MKALETACEHGHHVCQKCQDLESYRLWVLDQCPEQLRKMGSDAVTATWETMCDGSKKLFLQLGGMTPWGPITSQYGLESSLPIDAAAHVLWVWTALGNDVTLKLTSLSRRLVMANRP